MTKGKFLDDLRDNIWCRLEPSLVHGIGVFAIRDIPKGTSIFSGSRSPRWKKISWKEIDAFGEIPEEVKEYMRDLYPIEDGFVFFPDHGLNAVDISYFLNHSDTPNVVLDTDDNSFVTLSLVRKGEELFSDYRTYSD